MPHQQHPSSSSSLPTSKQRLESLLLAKIVSNSCELEEVQAQIMSGEAEIVGEKNAFSTRLRLSYAETSPAFLLLTLMTR